MARKPNEPIVVITGLPRSGTSMMMRMLARGGLAILTDNLRKADKDNPFGYYEYEPVKQLERDQSWLPLARGKAVKIIYILLYSLPPDHHYKVLFMRRPLDEVVASQMKMRRQRRVEDSGLTREQLIEAFDGQLRQLYGWLGRQPHFDVAYVDYHEALADPAGTASEISRFLGLRLDLAAMAQAVDPSLYRNRSNGGDGRTRIQDGPSCA